jgi:hypothetical protein
MERVYTETLKLTVVWKISVEKVHERFSKRCNWWTMECVDLLRKSKQPLRS